MEYQATAMNFKNSLTDKPLIFLNSSGSSQPFLFSLKGDIMSGYCWKSDMSENINGNVYGYCRYSSDFICKIEDVDFWIDFEDLKDFLSKDLIKK